MAYFTIFESIIDMWHIANSDTILGYSILWYNQISTQIGMTRLKHAHSTQFYHPDIYHRVELIVKTWNTCQKLNFLVLVTVIHNLKTISPSMV